MQNYPANQMASWFRKVLSPTPQNLASTVLFVVHYTSTVLLLYNVRIVTLMTHFL